LLKEGGEQDRNEIDLTPNVGRSLKPCTSPGAQRTRKPPAGVKVKKAWSLLPFARRATGAHRRLRDSRARPPAEGDRERKVFVLVKVGFEVRKKGKRGKTRTPASIGPHSSPRLVVGLERRRGRQ
jgi:hypothetical protein